MTTKTNDQPGDLVMGGVMDVDALAQIIREVDGNHSLGAAALAEAIVDRLPPAEAQVAGGEMSLELRARDLLAAENDRAGYEEDAEWLRKNGAVCQGEEMALAAIVAALSAQPRHGGVRVPDGAVEALRDALSPDGHAVSIVFDSQESADRYRNQLNEAMQAQQNLFAQPRPAETVDSAAWREALDLPDGYEAVEFLPGIWQYEYDDAAGRVASGASWNHPALAAIAAWQSVHQRPPSAPVGVDVELSRDKGGKQQLYRRSNWRVRFATFADGVTEGERRTVAAALTQQPAAVDESAIRRALDAYGQALGEGTAWDAMRTALYAALAQPQGEG